MKKKTVYKDSKEYLKDTLDMANNPDYVDLYNFLNTPAGEQLSEELHRLNDIKDLSPDRDKMWSTIRLHMKRDTKHRRMYRISYVAATIMLLLATGLGLWMVSRISMDVQLSSDSVEYALYPGSKKAILQLSHGESITLGDISENIFINESNGVVAEVQQGGVLTYNDAEKSIGQIQNILIVPRGGEYIIKLSDGSTVYLNSDSRLIYPVSFNGKERRVRLQGEGYFEVEENSGQPFIVEVDNMEVTVLGTQFNVNAYKDHGKILTTVAEGMVDVRQTGSETLACLTPGEQAGYVNGRVVVKRVNLEQVTSWITGDFNFEKMTLQDIMRHLERWYDINVSFGVEELKNYEFTGVIKRDFSAGQIFEIIEKTTRVQFIVNNREVTITSLK